MTFELVVKGSATELISALSVLAAAEASSKETPVFYPVPSVQETAQSEERAEAPVKPLVPEKGLKKVSSSPAPKQEKKKAEAEESDANITLEQDQKENAGSERLSLEDLRAVFNEKMKTNRAGLKEVLSSYGVSGLTAFHDENKDDNAIRREFLDKISAL